MRKDTKKYDISPASVGRLASHWGGALNLSVFMGVGKNAIYAWIGGRSVPNEVNLWKIGQLLGIEVADPNEPPTFGPLSDKEVEKKNKINKKIREVRELNDKLKSNRDTPFNRLLTRQWVNNLGI